jgi:phosphoglycolate phosphatase
LLHDDALARFLDYYGRHLLDRTKSYADIPNTLRDLRRRGVTLSVLTNKPENMSRAILEGLDLAGFFGDVVGGDTFPTRKPHPRGLDHLIRGSETAPERVLLVGDSAVDLHTAEAGGVVFCGVAWGIGPDQLRAAGVEPLLQQPRELVALVMGEHKGQRGHCPTKPGT